MLLSLCLCAAAAAISLLPAIEEVSRRVTDSYFRTQPSTGESDVVVIAIDDASLQKYGRWPWSRSTLAHLIRAAAAENPRVIGIDILFSEPQSETADADLREALLAAKNVVLVDKITAFPDGSRWIEPLPEFESVALAVGHAQAVLDADGICRSFPLQELSLTGQRYAFAVEIARHVDKSRTRNFASYYGLSSFDSTDHLIVASPILIPIAFRSNPIGTVSAVDVLSKNNHAKFRDKIVLIGFGASEIGDRITTPVSRGLPTPGIEIHAQILDSILASRRLEKTSLKLSGVLLLITAFLAVQVFRRGRGWNTLPLTAGVGVIVYIGGMLAFQFAHRILPMGSVLLTTLLAPLMIYGVELAVVEGSIARQMRLLQRSLAYREQDKANRSSDLPWRLEVLNGLQQELGLRFELYRSLLEATRDLVAVFDKTGELLFANQSFHGAWNELVPGTIAEVRASMRESEEAPLTASGVMIEGEARLNGTMYTVRLVPLPATSLTPNGGTLLSMTSLHARMERDRARQEALGFVTHELRTPLVAIQGFAELMTRFPDSPSSSQAPETILRESKRLLAVINSYLDVLRMEAGARLLRDDVVHISCTVAQVFDLLAPLAEASSIHLKSSCDENLSLRGDEPLLTGALLNLVSNAIKYGEKNSSVLVSAELHGAELELRVHNFGQAIAPEEFKSIFDVFVRSGDDEARRPGWGIGLSFVKRIAERHGGKVLVESSVELGTTFTLLLPNVTAAVGASTL